MRWMITSSRHVPRERSCKAARQRIKTIYHFILTKFAGHSPSLDTFCQQVKTNPAEGGLVSSVVGERQKTTKGDENAQIEPDHYPGN